MAKVTFSIDDSLLQAARLRVIREGTSVNKVCRRAIEVYARRQGDRLAQYRELQARIDADPGVKGKRPGQGEPRGALRRIACQAMRRRRSFKAR